MTENQPLTCKRIAKRQSHLPGVKRGLDSGVATLITVSTLLLPPETNSVVFLPLSVTFIQL